MSDVGIESAGLMGAERHQASIPTRLHGNYFKLKLFPGVSIE
jgi:hypothetical protein